MKRILKVIFNFSLIVINSSIAIKPFSLAETWPAFQTVDCGTSAFTFSVANVATLKGVFPFLLSSLDGESRKEAEKTELRKEQVRRRRGTGLKGCRDWEIK